MRIKNNEKERDRIYLRANIQSCITNVTNESNQLQDTIGALQNVIGGTASGRDGTLIGYGQQALQQISVALQNLNQSIGFADAIDTTEEVEDGQY